jgi:hypothetical protein
MRCLNVEGSPTTLLCGMTRSLDIVRTGQQLFANWTGLKIYIGALAAIMFWQIPPVAGQGVCSVSTTMNPKSASDTLNVPEYVSGRPLVAGDYVVIEYNASQKKKNTEEGYDPNAGLTSWTDYKHGGTNIIGPNGSFLPVVYTKEKIAVRVCGLHFTDVVTVTTSPNGAPENAADIRGAAPVTPPPSLSNTLDMLQAGTATGGTTTLPGLGLNAPTALPSLTLSGMTPGSLGAEDQSPGKYPSYTPATVTASGRQVALLLYSLEANAKELSRLIDRTMGEPYPTVKKKLGDKFREDARAMPEGTQAEMQEEAPAKAGSEPREKSAPGSVKGVTHILDKILENVRNDEGNLSDNAAFDRDMTDIQNANAQVSTLAGALTSQAFASDTITLLNNFSILTGVLNLADLARAPKYCQAIRPTLEPGSLSEDDLKKIDLTNLGDLTLAQVKGIGKDQIKELPQNVQNKVRAIQDALAFMQNTEAPGDKPLCSMFEKEKIAEFWEDYYKQVGYLLQEVAADQSTADENMHCDDKGLKAEGLRATVEYPYIRDPDREGNDRFAAFAGCRMNEVSEKINALRDWLRYIDADTTELYNRMNEWYFKSDVEQTDLLSPLTANAFLRISIVVQRGYTPFTLANAGGSITPTATANVPMTSTSASTSTPAHAVKTILVEVHRLANFNLMGGVMFIHIPTASYALQSSQATPSTTTGSYTETCGATTTTVTPSGSATPTYSCMVQTQHTDWQLAAMAGLLWYPWGRDYFPRHEGFWNHGHNLIPSFLVATSVSSLGNSMGGVDWEPMNGVDFFAGLGSAHRTVPPPNLTTNTIIPSGSTLQTQTQEHAGLTLGVGFDLSVIAGIFSSKSTSVATMP